MEKAVKAILDKKGMKENPIDIIPRLMAAATRRPDGARTIVPRGSPPQTLFVSRVPHRLRALIVWSVRASVPLASGAVTPQLMRGRERGGEKSNARTARVCGPASAERAFRFLRRGSFARRF